MTFPEILKELGPLISPITSMPYSSNCAVTRLITPKADNSSCALADWPDLNSTVPSIIPRNPMLVSIKLIM
jgi:hypothetical protein